MSFQKRHLLMAADTDSNPSFTVPVPSSPQENREDETDILTDQDQTRIGDDVSLEENMGAKTNSLDSLEDEPGDFLRGEIDVKEQMDRAASTLEDSIQGYERHADEDSPRGDLGATFRDTPGGIEEVEQKTEEDLAQHRGHRENRSSVKH